MIENIKTFFTRFRQGDKLAGHRPASIIEQALANIGARKKNYSYNQLANIASQLGEMLEAGVDLELAFYTLSKYDVGRKVFGDGHWRTLLAEGRDLSFVFIAYNFPQLFVNTVRSGESSGNLYDSLHILADYYEKLAELKSKFIQALIYPLMIFMAVLFSLYFMLVFVLPNFAKLYRGLGLEIPATTAGLFRMQAWLASHELFLLALLLGFLFLIYLIIRVKAVQQYLLWLGLYVPGVNRIVRYVNTHVLVMQLSMLIRGGVSVQEALTDIDKLFSGKLVPRIRGIRDQVLTGMPLSQAVEDAACFDNNINNFIELGESTGKLDAAFTSAEIFYNQSMKRTIDYVIKIVEPAMLLLMGMTVLFVIVSMLLPIFDLLESI